MYLLRNVILNLNAMIDEDLSSLTNYIFTFSEYFLLFTQYFTGIFQKRPLIRTLDY